MNKLKLFFALVCLALILFSCKDEKKSPEHLTQMERVMEIHDEVMPKMGTVGRLASRVGAKVNDTELGKQFKTAQHDLENANEAMMDWMVTFGEKFDTDEIVRGKVLTPEKQALLDAEEEKIKVVRDKINISIANAEELLKKVD